MKLFAPHRGPVASANPNHRRGSAQVLPVFPPAGINEPIVNNTRSGLDQADGQNHHRGR